MNACTIVSRRQLPLARVLARAHRAHHADARFVTVVVDGDLVHDAPSGDLDIVGRNELPIDERQFLDMAFIYHEAEFIRALKPYALRYLVEEFGAPALFVAPEVAVYAPLDGVLSPSAPDRVVLVPHTTVPFPDDGRAPSVYDLLGRGNFDSGLLAVGPDAGRFLDYWSGHLHLDCVFEPQNLAWADQRWLDPVPVMFPADIVHDAGVQVADWNLHARTLQSDGRVNGVALRTFHFRGFDPLHPHLLDIEMGTRPRSLLSEHPALADLCAARAAELVDAGWEMAQQEPYGWARLDDGTDVDDRMRRVFRMALTRGERPPAPFGAGTSPALFDWLATPEVESNARRPSRYLMQVWFERVDLHAAFPDPTGEHSNALLDWARVHGEREAAIPKPLVPAPLPAVVHAASSEPGVNLAGYVRAVLGLGEAARLLEHGLSAAGIAHVVVSAAGTQNEQSIAVELTAPNDAPYDVTVACVTADQLPVFVREVGPALTTDRHFVGFWFWENEQITGEMRRGLALVDEIWVASPFCADVFRSHTDKPVVEVPLPVLTPSSGASRSELGLPEDRFVFFNSFDFLSTFERKNPVGLVRAFVDAFAPDEGPLLVLKSINGDKRVPEREALRLAVRERPDIVLMEDYITPHEQSGLLLAADCFVSLHRSEGFGLGLAQCMALGKAAIATDYSGNLAFMTESNSWLVPHAMTTVGPNALPYPMGAPWAEPDVAAAATALREVFAGGPEVERRGEQAARDLAEWNSPARSGEVMRARLDEIRASTTASTPTPVDEPARKSRFRRR